jgi:putative ABC transport system substrate-binding protein
MRRRDFIATLAGSAATWPLVAVAQAPAVQVMGFLGRQPPEPASSAKFHQGLSEAGYFEGRNLKIEYRWTYNDDRRFPELAAELIQRRVALIVTTGGMSAAKAAKSATQTIPILFTGIGLDPVENGFLDSFNRPGGNATGVSFYHIELIPKRLELLRQLVPGAVKIAYLMNDDSSGLGPGERTQQEIEREIASRLGLSLHYARDENAIEAAFAILAEQRIEALLVASDPFFGRQQRARIVALAAHCKLPAGYSSREFVDAGGLMSYGPSRTESWREVGRYAGRILKGTRPQELPVQLQNKYELVINVRTAKELRLTVPPLLHALADDTIE